MTTAIYETTGHLTDAIPSDGIADAQRYLQQDHEGNPINMEQYLDQPLNKVVVSLRWFLDSNGYDYRIEAICSRKLKEDELRVLSQECSGQNSDGLGEGFEQQDFAWIDDADYDEYDNDDMSNEGHMCSFDWETNELPWTRIK